MTPSEWNDVEWDELLDLWAEDALPESLAARVEKHLASDTEAAQDAAQLRRTVARLRAVPSAQPDLWLAERVLSRMLREHAAEQSPTPPPDFSPALDILTS